MRVASTPQELGAGDRAVAIGTFDGVHLGHRRVIEAALAAGLQATVLTFDPHPRVALGHRVEVICTLERRLELLESLGIAETLVLPFTPDLSLKTAEEFARSVLEPLGARIVVAGSNFRFGRGRSGDLDTLAGLGFDARPVPLVEGVSSSRIRQLVSAGEVGRAAKLLGRPVEIEGVVVAGDARGGTLGFPTANLAAPSDLLVPAFGIYAGEALGHRAATSIGINPHYGGEERRIEAFLLDYDDDLYGRRLVVELWERLREERAFDSEADLVEQIRRDVDATRGAVRPV
ncbi:MAG TPA: bifunctional riboflavin kinase/FMN adenylyltransferase [Gaiellaceae bacterium]|nr:bifunctional riboflavin kinase/FMN adenylyltransferase [Gaiellaceae bacterium]